MNKKTMNQHIKQITYHPLSHYRMNFLVSILLLLLILSIDIMAEDTNVSTNMAYKITSPVSGVVKQIYVTKGKMIKKGDLLLEFDDTLIAANLSEAQANIQLARLNRTEAKKERQRAEELYDRTVLSDHDLQLAKVLYAKAQAQLASAENQLIHAQWEVKHSKLYATFSGQVSQVLTYPGQYVNNQFSVQPLLWIKNNMLK